MGNLKTINVMLDENAIMPTRAHNTDAGLDLYTPVDFIIGYDDADTIDTGVHVEIPEGYVGFLKSKSGLNVKNNIITEGVIDAGYTGSIVVKVRSVGNPIEFSERSKIFHRGDKITQLVILPIETPELVLVDSFKETDRGDNGFGSTGR